MFSNHSSLRLRSAAGAVALALMVLSGGAFSQNRLRFDFGPGRVAQGYTLVLPNTMYRKETGFGFEPGAALDGINREPDDPLVGDFVTSDRPFFFSVALPQGNYNVTVTLVDMQGTRTTVKAELRRLMLENIVSPVTRGSSATATFTVNIRDPLLPDGDQVRLKDRERTTESWAWDEKLTLEFNGSRPALCALEIKPANTATVFLLGDSTVCDQPREPYNSWGQMLPRFFKSTLIAIANHAESGESLRSSIAARRFDKVYATMKRGDYVFLQFGHNDQKEKGEGIGAMTTFKSDLETVVDLIRRRHGIPVLVTSMNRRSFGEDRKVYNTLGDYPDAVRRVAKEKGVALIDLHMMSKDLYESLGPEGSEVAFKSGDGTHHSNYGSYQLAKCVAEGIRANRLPLARYLIDGLPKFDPKVPDRFFMVQPSPYVSEVRPLGN